MHSEGAALLLVWAANLIKFYACTKYLGELDQSQGIANTSPRLDMDEVHRISARTKIMVRKDQEGNFDIIDSKSKEIA